MKKSGDDSFLQYVLDQLRDVDGVAARRMFASHGLYRDGIFFGVVWRGQFFLKTNDATRAKYVRAGMEPFRPTEKQTIKSYYEVPAEILDDRDQLARWTTEAIACAKPRADKPVSRRRPKK